MAEKSPEEDGYRSIAIFKEAQVQFLVDLLKWMDEVWFPENGYASAGSIMRNTSQGFYEIMAKPQDTTDASV